LARFAASGLPWGNKASWLTLELTKSILIVPASFLPY